MSLEMLCDMEVDPLAPVPGTPAVSEMSADIAWGIKPANTNMVDAAPATGNRSLLKKYQANMNKKSNTEKK